MFRTIDEMAVLFNKIQSGEATEEERMDYDINIKISCMKEEFLLALIEQGARELKAEQSLGFTSHLLGRFSSKGGATTSNTDSFRLDSKDFSSARGTRHYLTEKEHWMTWLRTRISWVRKMINEIKQR